VTAKTPANRLDPIALALDCYRRLWASRDHALRLGLPLLVLGLVWNMVFGNETGSMMQLPVPNPDMTPEELEAMQAATFRWMMISIAYAVPFVLLNGVLIGNMTRLLLIGPAATRPWLGLALDGRLVVVVWRFVQAVLLSFLLGLVAFIPLSLALTLIGTAGGAGIGIAAMLFAGLVLASIGLRLSVAAYATAIDRPTGMREAWRLTEGNGISLLGAYLAVNLPIFGLLLVVVFILGALATVVPHSVQLIVSLVALVSSLASVAVVALAVEKLMGGSRTARTVATQ
jgi:hypothetical protein